jgi:PIN domain nuclease of toxin-antitoxin system
VRLLLDTNVLIWSLAEPEKLTRAILELLSTAANEVFVSTVSPWEMAIKLSSGKLRLRSDLQGWLPRELRDYRYRLLDIQLAHVVAVERLPRRHGDPFDRLLIAQAQIEGLTIVTSDRHFEQYDVPVIWS